MANRIIKIGSNASSFLPISLQNDSMYVDISMLADPSFHAIPQKRDINEYLALLVTEHGSELGAFDYIVSEESAYSQESKEYIRLQYDQCLDYGKALRLWYTYGNWKIGTLADVNAIRNSLHLIFTWIPGERILLPEFGSNLRMLLYEGITDYNVERIMAEIRHCVSEWEPRVSIQKVVKVGTVDDTEDNTVHIEVIYTIPGLTDDLLYSEPIVFDKR